MNPEINEVIVRSKQRREPMSFERLKFLCYFVVGILGEVFGFALLLVLFLGMFGVFRR